MSHADPRTEAPRPDGMSPVPVPVSPGPDRRRILLSAFACSPMWGSEPGVGWQWLVHLARHHDVVLLTHGYFRQHIEPALQSTGLTVEVLYLEPWSGGLHPHRQLNSRAYYTWWQWRARCLVRQVLRSRRFDLIHHLTWGTLRFPCFLGGLGVPLAMGPLGGGESAPLRFFSGLPWRIQAFDYVRSLTLLWVRLDPLATIGPRRSEIVLCKSRDTLEALPLSVRDRAYVVPEIGSNVSDAAGRPASALRAGDAPRPARLLFAGRLLGWKGVALALGATRELLQQGREVTLDIAGEGPLRAHLEREIAQHRLGERVRLLGNLPRDRLTELYRQADLFVFPSLHDSSGNVVLESLAQGLPVVCLDVGGPQLYVDASCGLVVKTAGLTRRTLEHALAHAIGSLLDDPQRLQQMARAAVDHARRQSWEAAVQRAYALIERRLAACPT